MKKRKWNKKQTKKLTNNKKKQSYCTHIHTCDSSGKVISELIYILFCYLLFLSLKKIIISPLSNTENLYIQKIRIICVSFVWNLYYFIDHRKSFFNSLFIFVLFWTIFYWVGFFLYSFAEVVLIQNICNFFFIHSFNTSHIFLFLLLIFIHLIYFTTHTWLHLYILYIYKYIVFMYKFNVYGGSQNKSCMKKKGWCILYAHLLRKNNQKFQIVF